MTEERRFRIKEIKKYDTDLTQNKKGIIFSCVLVACAALCHYCEYTTGNIIGHEGLMYSCGYLLHSINIVSCLSENNKLSKKIEQLKEDLGPLYEQYLNEYNQEVNKGRSR